MAFAGKSKKESLGPIVAAATLPLHTPGVSFWGEQCGFGWFGVGFTKLPGAIDQDVDRAKGFFDLQPERTVSKYPFVCLFFQINLDHDHN